MVVVESKGISDVGRKRKGNEDSLLVDEALGLYVVADGMGGHLAGEVASKIVVDSIRDYMKRFKAGEKVEELEATDDEYSKEANRLLASIHLANRSVYSLSKEEEAYKGMGSTVSAVYFADDTLMAANVGDSPIYLIHNGEIELLSVMHTVMAEHAALDPSGTHELSQQFSHMLTRAMGIEETVNPDISEIQCFPGDALVISSDGLTDEVSPEEILEVVKKERPEKACQSLVDMANDRGGNDNVTVVVLKIKSIKGKGDGLLGPLSRILGGGAASIAGALKTMFGATFKIVALLTLLCVLAFLFLFFTMESDKVLLEEIVQDKAKLESVRTELTRNKDDLKKINLQIEALSKKDLTRKKQIEQIDLTVKASELAGVQEKIESNISIREEKLKKKLAKVQEIQSKSFFQRLLKQ